MTTLARLLLLPALVVTSLAATAAPVRYALDPVHTRVLFAVEHAGFSKALGTVSGTSGTLVFDPDDWASARLDVTVPLRRADLGDAKWNEATLARNLLDAERFPDAHFVSTQVEASGQNHAKVTGNLTLHGVTRPVTLDVTLNALKRHPLPPFRRTAGFSAAATLSRAEFGIDAWKSMIGDTVELRIEAEAVREGRADDDAPQPQPQNAPAAPDAAPSPES
ncbi:YceI family protein [Xanthomonas arboricola pv. corylina]|uniref:Protein YceI n=1 Tax=Xanthomonas arboricola pv. corylina TaxID=487821 RepID=A0A2S7CQ35_9XANT|nr:YceI family protein [Xanthomonas arboricola]MDN0202398.1 YceI family protein [Xanthomonas arboricola pv. corylina]MDN0206493.1 YceI family protein [Xanthomonas arboricola pv. corylina]MDN0210468.1 YceI family protein [Xanthomonas arboricola pv. corylina]MDN0215079.1 YceI family protein [Xanthomonas arboricola pv. corylina]PPU16194.1 polyisoprenoid-binding protein [Xanthomonas arboricola pv. corylina]